MSNDYFAFKQFRVAQDRCAMKVSTDACIQGAWTPVESSSKRVLDIGAGTGLLSLMIAQRAPGASIDALELNKAAAAQAMENVAASPFADRIKVVHSDALGWSAGRIYELIVCNPPFFKNSLQGPDPARNAARHGGGLNAESLCNIILSNLSAEGVASLMWPPREFEKFHQTAGSLSLRLRSRLLIRDRLEGRITRIIGIFGRAEAVPTEETLVIKGGDGTYTPEFIRLLSPFYLRL